MSGTLPLFSELGAGALESVPEIGARAAPRPGPAAAPAAMPAAAKTDAGQRHLRAAWRLSRSMHRYRAGSAEETRAGRAICHHLQALLQQGEPAAVPPVRK